MKHRGLVILSTAALIVILFIVFQSSSAHVPPGQPPLVDVNPGELSVLQAEFNRADAGLRIILLLSPT